jgi:hypothetical protein
MATAREVLSMLLPNGGYVLVGDTYEGIQFEKGTTLTKTQFEAGFAQYESLKTQREQELAANKTAAEAKLAALGITSADLKALGL